MAKHETVPLVANFTSYQERRATNNSTYYVFQINLRFNSKDAISDICRMDSIHRSRVLQIFQALDGNRTINAPVVRDPKGGYRIDLSAIGSFFPSHPTSYPPIEEEAPLPSLRQGVAAEVTDETPKRLQATVSAEIFFDFEALATKSGCSKSRFLGLLIEKEVYAARKLSVYQTQEGA
jgi:hypothetical protein